MNTKHNYALENKMKSILHDTINHFNRSNLAREQRESDGELESVYYARSTGNMCSVGRYLNDPQQIQNYCYCCNYPDSSINSVIEDQSSNIFKEGFQDIPLRFWGSLQMLHDVIYYWDNNGLSELGERRVKKILDCIDSHQFVQEGEEE